MEPCVPLLITFLLLSLAFGTAWAQEEQVASERPEGSDQPSNIESWGEEEPPAPTWFGMGFESRESDSIKPGQQNSDRVVNNW